MSDKNAHEFIDKIKKENFVADSIIEERYNETRDHVILLKKIDSGIGYPKVIEFLVLDLENKKVVYKDSVIDGNVSWLDNDVIIIKRVTEARSKDPEENIKAEQKQINIRKL